MPACSGTPAPSFSLTGSLNLLVRVRNKRAIDTQVWSLSGNRGNMWQQAHVPINPPGPFQVSQVHSQGAICHLSCPCAMGCRRLPSRHLPPWHRGWSGTWRALGAFHPQGQWGKARAWWMHRNQMHFSLKPSNVVMCKHQFGTINFLIIASLETACQRAPSGTRSV